MVGKLRGKTAVVTGGAGAIGGETARLLAKNGATVYINDVSSEAGEALVSQIRDAGGEAVFLRGDVTSESDMKALIETAVSRFGKIDILINNAGVNVGSDDRRIICDYDEGAWNRVTDICLDGLFFCTKYTLPHMRRQGGGCIVNIGSVAGFRAPLRLQSPYSAAKAMVLNMTRTLATENGIYGIRVNGVVPGSVMNAHLNDVVYKDDAMRESMLSHVPMRVIGEPVDIGNSILYIVSDEAKYVTGCILTVDGGWSAGYSAG